MSVPTSRRQRRSHVVKFLEKVHIEPGGCWLWQGHIQSNGYGFYRHDDTTLAHRAGYLILRGPIPDGLCLDHLCRVKACVNPEHLEAVTQRVNVHRGDRMNRTACAKYHPSEEPRWGTRADGRRICRECGRVREQQRRDARALAAAGARDPQATHAGKTEEPQPNRLGL